MYKDSEYMKRYSIKHRLAMARNYQKPEKFLTQEEMPLYEQELKNYKKRFEHLDLFGPYRPEQVDGRWYVVGHGEVSYPVYDFEAALRLLITKEQALKTA